MDAAHAPETMRFDNQPAIPVSFWRLRRPLVLRKEQQNVQVPPWEITKEYP